MKIALLQFDTRSGDKEKNLKSIDSLLSKKKNRADIAIFPEVGIVGYSTNAPGLAESENGKSITTLKNIAKKHSCMLIGGYIKKNESGKPHNSAIIVDKKGTIIDSYDKQYLMSFLNEDKKYEKGKKPTIIHHNETAIGIAICYDLRFPELFHYYKENNVKLMVVIAAWPEARIEHWDTLLRARALDNQIFIAGVNRIGISDIGTFSGHSQIINPFGDILLNAKSSEGIYQHTIDTNDVEKIRNEFPISKDK